MKKTLIALCAFMFLAAWLVQGQVNTGTINGQVTDPQGAAVAGAQVTATSQATGQSRSTQSGPDGTFAITSLPAGVYDLKVEAKGFGTAVQKGIGLQVGTAYTANIALKVAGMTQEIAVLAESGQVDVSSSTVEGVINQKSIAELPLNGRNFMELSFLVPGNSLAPGFDPTKARAVEVSSLGNLGRGTNTTIDGVENNDSQIGGVAMNYTQESIQEFQVVTGRFSAEFGRAGFNALNVVTKSGSNTLHGTGFFFVRDDALQAKGPFGTSKPPFDREQFGGSLGGPIVRDKAFFFGTVERTREQGATTAGTRDAATRTIVQSFASTPFRETLLTGKVDLHATRNDQFGFRYSLQKNNDTDPGTSRNGLLQDPNNFEDQRNTFHQFVANWTRVVSPSKVNDLRFNLLYSENRIQPLNTDLQVVFPSINVGANFRADQGNIQHRLEFKDDFSWTAGKHTIKFGGTYSHLSLPEPTNFNLFGPGLAFATCDFPGDPGCPSATTDGEIPVAVALINQLTLTGGFPGFGIRGAIPATADDTLGLYVQDDWRITPHLTLNLGLRWEYDNDFIGKHQVNQFTPGKRSADKADFGPRIGFAWDATHDGRTSIRGGYGLYYDHNVIETRQLELLVDGVRLPIVASVSDFVNGPVCTIADPFCNLLPGGPPDIQVTANNLRQPYVHQFSAGFQREITHDTVVTADYIATRGRHFQRQVEVNKQFDGSKLNPNFGSVIETQTIANTAYDGLLATVQRRFSKRIQFLGSYTLSRSINQDNDLLGFISVSSIPTNPGIDVGPAPNESRHRFVFSGVFEAPWGIQFSPIVTTFSSVPVNIVQNADFSGGFGTGFNRLPGLGRNAGNRTVHTGADVNKFIDAANADPNVLAVRAAQGLGPIPNVNPNIDLSHPFFTFDFRLIKRFTFSDRFNLDVGGEAFNIFNHINILGIANSNFSGLQNNVENPNFGKPLGVTPGGVFGTGGPRAFQFLAKFHF
jgi:outer membrane receptor protein involved in Fe transport